MNRLEGKTIIITGGAKGIGRAACIKAAAEGAHVAVTDILDDDGKECVKEIKDNGGSAKYWHLDVSNENEVKSVMNQIKEEFGRIDILVNNAGISGANKPTHEVTEEEWDKLMAINVKGVFFCTKHVVPEMKNAGGGSIINLSSIYGIISAADNPPYHASKGAVRLMTKTDALLYAEDNIRVNSVHPGFIWTPMVEDMAKKSGDKKTYREKIAKRHPIGRVGDPDDIAYGIIYLASEESKFMTGSELVIDGGYTAR